MTVLRTILVVLLCCIVGVGTAYSETKLTSRTGQFYAWLAGVLLLVWIGAFL